MESKRDVGKKECEIGGRKGNGTSITPVKAGEPASLTETLSPFCSWLPGLDWPRTVMDSNAFVYEGRAVKSRNCGCALVPGS